MDMTQTATPALTFDTETCTRCNGEGHLTQYRHIAGGVCAKCNGTRVQMSRKGRAAHRAFDKALAERLGRRADQVQAGQTIHDSYGPCRVDRVDVEEDAHGTAIWFVTFHENGHSAGARPPHRIVRLHDPAVEAEIAAQFAARYPGATLTPTAA